MNDETAIVTRVMDHPEDDGTHLIEITTTNQEKVLAAIPPDAIQDLVWRLQNGMIHRVFRESKSVRGQVKGLTLTEWHMREVQIAHRERETNLYVHTDEVGAFVLNASDQILRQLKKTIDDVLTSRGAPTVN